MTHDLITHDEMRIISALEAQGKLPREVITRAFMIARVFAALARSETVSPHISQSDADACLRAHPACRAFQCGEPEWHVAYWHALAFGFDGRPGVGPEAAVIFAIGELLAVTPGHREDIATLRDFAAQWCIEARASLNTLN